MKLAVLGSGSRGNALAIHAEGATLLVDAGFGPRALVQRAADAGLPLEPLAGIVVTHEHRDHARGAAALAARARCPVVGTPGTLHGLRVTGCDARPVPPFGDPVQVGPFAIQVARSPHDAEEPVAVAVTDSAGRRVGIAWDLGRPTAAVRHLLRGAHALVVEANHDEVLLQSGPYPASVRQRIAGSTGHLSNRMAADLLADLCSPALEVVILAHLSEPCNEPGLARRTVASALRARGFRGQLLVARQDAPSAVITLRPVAQIRLALPAAGSPRS